MAFWPLMVTCCRRMNERTFEGKAAESLKNETLGYPRWKRLRSNSGQDFDKWSKVTGLKSASVTGSNPES
jgi:hypothetical protein